jgi:hypothetical protein
MMPDFHFIRRTFFFFMSCNICLVFFVFFFLPETQNIPLEQMDTLFGDVSHTAAGAELVDEKVPTTTEHLEEPSHGRV